MENPGEKFLGWYERHNPHLVRLAGRLIGTGAEDVAAEAWMVAWSKRDELRNEDAFWTWIKGHLRNAIKAERRRQGRIEEVADEPVIVRIEDGPRGEFVWDRLSYRITWSWPPPDASDLFAMLGDIDGASNLSELARRADLSSPQRAHRLMAKFLALAQELGFDQVDMGRLIQFRARLAWLLNTGRIKLKYPKAVEELPPVQRSTARAVISIAKSPSEAGVVINGRLRRGLLEE